MRCILKMGLTPSLAALVLSACGTSQTVRIAAQLDDVQRELLEVKKQLATQTVMNQNLETDLFTFKDRLETLERNRNRRAKTGDELSTVRIRPESGPEARFDARGDAPTPVARRDDPGREPDCALGDVLTEDGQRLPGCGKADGRSARDDRGAPGGSRVEPEPQPAERAVRPSPKRADVEAKTAYETAMSDYRAGRFYQATEAFLDFVDRFPRHEYADNALYWAGECYYTRALWNKALDLFARVVESYPMENKTADAMVKIGLCQMNLGNTQAARDAFESVIGMYPDSPVANLAKQKLEGL